MILDGLQAGPERWTDKEVLDRRGVATTMLHNRGFIGSGEGVRSHPETGWASSNAVSLSTSVLRREINSCTAILAK